MLSNGLYSITFRAGPGGPAGSGVIVLRDGRLMGGDSSLLYQGTYQHYDGKFAATVQTSRHADAPSLFGLDKATLSFAGTIIRGVAVGFGASPQMPDLKLEVRLVFRAP